MLHKRDFKQRNIIYPTLHYKPGLFANRQILKRLPIINRILPGLNVDHTIWFLRGLLPQGIIWKSRILQYFKEDE